MKPDPQALLQQLNTLQTQIVELAAASHLSPLTAVGEQTSLKELKNLLHQLASSESSTFCQQAIHILDRFLSLIHLETPDFPPLVSYQNQVREFRARIANLPNAELPPEVQSLVEGKHPVSVLLILLERGNQLQDAEWVSLTETIAKSLGQPIAIAASRNKLAFKDAPPSPISAPTATPQEVDPLIWGKVSPSSIAPLPSATPQIPTEPPIVFGAKSLGLETTDTPTPSALPLKILVHIQDVGDQEFGASEFAGTRGQAKGIEGFQILLANPIPGLQLECMAHLAGIGDTPWTSASQFIGTRGENRRLEGFAIRLSGPEAAKYQVCYTAHIQNVGDHPTCTNGQYCGTRAQSLRIEAMKVWIERIA
jgi:Clostridial hydrophobic W